MKSFPQFQLSFHEPPRNSPCLCGSGKKFKKCCGPLYSNEEKNLAYEKYNSGHFQEALKACRLHITWYILAHRAHTVQGMKLGLEKSHGTDVKIDELFDVDIKALAGLLDLLMLCYKANEILSAFPNALTILTNAISDNRWYNRIAYLRALWQLVYTNDEALALHEIEMISDVENVYDVDILTLYIQLSSEKLSTNKTIKLIDMILECKPNPGIVLQYTTRKGLCYLLLNDKASACEIINDGLDTFKSQKSPKLSIYDKHKFANALELLGELREENKLIDEAIFNYKSCIESGELNKAGVAMINKHLGDCLLSQNNYEMAKKHYELSIKAEENELARIFLVLVNAYMGLHDEAKKNLNRVDESKIDKWEICDLSISYAIVALESNNIRLLQEAKERLNKIEISLPYFINQRKKVIKEIITSLKEQQSNSDHKKKSFGKHNIFHPNYHHFIQPKTTVYNDNRRYYINSPHHEDNNFIQNQNISIINNLLNRIDSPDFKRAELIQANNEFQILYDSLDHQKQDELKEQTEKIILEKDQQPGFNKERIKCITKWAIKEGWEIGKNVLISILATKLT